MRSLGLFPLWWGVCVAFNGTKFKDLINCFAWYGNNAAYDPENSHTESCKEDEIVLCRLKGSNTEHFCRFDGTNKLQEVSDTPTCYFNCAMDTCDAWQWGVTDLQKYCIDNLLKDGDI
jgi:hypothetical protein